MMKGLKELLYEETLQHLVLLNVHLSQTNRSSKSLDVLVATGFK